MYQIVNDIQLPEKATTRNRERGEFSKAVNSLEVGQGFQFASTAAFKNLYPRVAPKKFGGKTFKLAEVTAAVAGTQDTAAVEGVYIVKRVS